GLRLQQQERLITRFRTQKTGGLLAYLAYHRQQSHAREVLIELFWPETTPESGRHNLSHALSSLRSLLEPPGVPAGTVLIADRFTVELNPEAFTTDVAQFEQALRAAAQARNTPEHAPLLALALEKCTGELLPGYYEDWIEPAQERIRQRYQQAHTQLDSLRSTEAFARVPTPVTPAVPKTLPSALPTGTVTFLFTDIEGSTRLWERVGDTFRTALSTHHTLLRREFRRRGGHEVKEAGDSFLVAFASVGDALDCAIACQRALDTQSWPDELGSLRVRMALHTGDVELVGGEYHGIMLHRAARMLSAAHGGQILCSEATSNLLVRDLEPQVTLKDLGIWRLRDIQEPERLFQASYPDRSLAEFPPLNASPAHSTHLPLQFTRFFGRETEITQLVELLASPQTRLLTLTGPGGTGKTRLSLEAAGRFAGSFAGAVWFVPLADLSDPSLIPTAILQAMSISLSGSTEPLEQAVSVLNKRPTLLILDNFEQLVEGGVELVQTLLSRVGTLQCLVTSRQLLGLPGEVEFTVSPLATPNGSDTPERLGLFESVRLFVDRAQAAKPDFRITNSNAPAVAELCDRLEGIPLAIELAAARALVLSPSQMLAQLGNRFEFLVSRKRGLKERHRTLRAAIDWSYRLLTPDVQRFFCQLCVFRGGWSLEAAEEVCDEPLALDMLAQLRECSLLTTVESESGIRFRILETLREYAENQLFPQELAILRERHAQFFVALAEEAKPHMTGQEQPLWLDRLEAELDNVRGVLLWSCSEAGDVGAGLRIAAGYWHLWVVRGYVTEGRKWLSGLFVRDMSDQDAGIRAEVLHASGTMALYEADNTVVRAHLEESLAISREQGDVENSAKTQARLATLAQHNRDYLTARVLLEECLTVYRGLGNKRGIANTQFRLGHIAYNLGDFLTAQKLMMESFPVLREVGDQRILASALLTLGSWALEQEDYSAAQEYLEESLKTFRAVGDQVGIAWALLNQGSTARALKDLTTARERTLQGLGIFRKLSHPGNTTIAIEHLTHITFQLGELVRAARLWGAAERQREEMGWGDISSEFVHHAQAIAAAREALGDNKAFDHAWQEGRAMTREQAVAYALEESGE
uniref:AfsR/SARP family transcriptional regulator n=1 Tax=Armatimonas sp. TaxID=1872638 RepID=UPI003753DF3E